MNIIDALKGANLFSYTSFERVHSFKELMNSKEDAYFAPVEGREWVSIKAGNIVLSFAPGGKGSSVFRLIGINPDGTKELLVPSYLLDRNKPNMFDEYFPFTLEDNYPGTIVGSTAIALPYLGECYRKERYKPGLEFKKNIMKLMLGHPLTSELKKVIQSAPFLQDTKRSIEIPAKGHEFSVTNSWSNMFNFLSRTKTLLTQQIHVSEKAIQTLANNLYYISALAIPYNNLLEEEDTQDLLFNELLAFEKSTKVKIVPSLLDRVLNTTIDHQPGHRENQICRFACNISGKELAKFYKEKKEKLNQSPCGAVDESQKESSSAKHDTYLAIEATNEAGKAGELAKLLSFGVDKIAKLSLFEVSQYPDSVKIGLLKEIVNHPEHANTSLFPFLRAFEADFEGVFKPNFAVKIGATNGSLLPTKALKGQLKKLLKGEKIEYLLKDYQEDSGLSTRIQEAYNNSVKHSADGLVFFSATRNGLLQMSPTLGENFSPRS